MFISKCNAILNLFSSLVSLDHPPQTSLMEVAAPPALCERCPPHNVIGGAFTAAEMRLYRRKVRGSPSRSFFGGRVKVDTHPAGVFSPDETLAIQSNMVPYLYLCLSWFFPLRRQYRVMTRSSNFFKARAGQDPDGTACVSAVTETWDAAEVIRQGPAGADT